MGKKDKNQNRKTYGQINLHNKHILKTAIWICPRMQKKAFASRANEIHFNIVAVAVVATKFSWFLCWLM
jgi:hypothetical protein